MNSKTNVVPLHPALPRGNKNYRKDRNGEPLYTPDQRRVREFAWMLYVTEGAVGNIVHAEAVNAFTLSREDLAAVRRARKLVEAAVHELRVHFRHTNPVKQPKGRRTK